MKPVLTKADFVRRYQEDEFGNHSQTWDNVYRFSQANYSGPVHLRNRVAGGETYYNLSPEYALYRWMSFSNGGQFYCSAMAPHNHNLLQGEVWDGPGGLYLHGSYEIGVPMRDALAVSAFDCTGLEAKLRLRQVFNDLSWEWLQWLIAEYEDHVIEFSAFSCCWGTIPGHNVVIWETRLY